MRATRWWLLGAVLLALAVRIPGVFWGANFPTGWYGHHVDEYTHLVNAERIINPTLPPRWPPHPYPSAMAAHAAVPLIIWRVARGQALAPLPSPEIIITTGRIFAVFYGAVTVLALYLLTRKLISDSRVAIAAAFFVALGGLHVSQSHFFLSDVPSICWFLFGLYFLWCDLERGESSGEHYLYAAGLCLGVAFGLKLLVYSLPTLALVTVIRRPRLPRMFFTALIFVAGIVIVNAGVFTTVDFFKTVTKGLSDPYQFSIWSSLLLYMVELPSVFSFPMLILAGIGALLLARRFLSLKDLGFAGRVTIIVLLPLLFASGAILKADHFPRHLLHLLPWIAIAAGWTLIQLADHLQKAGIVKAMVIAPVFLYLAVFVYDGERVFHNDPRNSAAKWVLANVPGGESLCWMGHNWIPNYRHMDFPDEGRPNAVVVEMHSANHYLSGMSLRNSYPSDYRRIFASRSASRVRQLQSLFRGTSEYREAVRFSEGYFMPEYRLADNLIGNRSRNYVAEVVIFVKKDASSAPRLATDTLD